MIFALIIFLTALSISVSAAYFSVVGLISIFSANPILIGLMGASLEAGKLVTASFLYRHWSNLNILLKSYLIIAVIILSGITSLGIFGYLSKSHTVDTINYTNNVTRIETLTQQLDIEKKRLVILLEQSGKFETPSRKIQNDINTTQDKISKITEELLPLKEISNKGNAEIGAIRYVSQLMYSSSSTDDIERSVRVIILLLVFVFDPLAILLVVSGNMELKLMKSRPSKAKKSRVKSWFQNLNTLTINKNAIVDFEKELFKKNNNTPPPKR